jgi:hypothetical protein
VVALTGQRYCPACFGVVRVPSWATCALDAGVVALLAVCRPPRAGLSWGGSFSWRGAVSVAAGTAVVCGTFFALTSDAALAALRGERISVKPAIGDVGNGRAGEKRAFEIQLTNHAATPINVFGGGSSCGCDPTGDLPLALAPGESRSIRVQVSFAGSPGRFQRRVKLFTDDQAQGIFTVRFSGRVVE